MKKYLVCFNKKTSYKNNKGAAMIVAIIIIAVLMIFTFSLMLVTYTLYASQNKKIANMKNREAANTLSKVLNQELSGDSVYTDSSLWKYLRCNLYQKDTWPYYDNSVSGYTSDYAYRYFDVCKNANYAVDGYPGEIKLCIYWTLPRGTTLSSDKTLNDLSIDEKRDAMLFIEIICETGGQTYTVLNKYKMVVSQLDENIDSSEIYALDKLADDLGYNPMRLPINNNEKWRFEAVQ